MNYLKRPFGGDGGDSVEFVVTAQVIKDEIVAYFHLSTQTEIEALAAEKSPEVDPELRFGDGDPVAAHTAVIPAVDEASKRETSVCEMESPHRRRLETVERTVPWVLSLEIILVHCLQRQGLAEVAACPIPSGSGKEGMLETGGILRNLTGGHTAIILHMSRPLLVGRDIELPGKLPICPGHTVMIIVNVGKEEGAAPLVGLEQFHGSGDTGSSRELIRK